MGRLFGDIASYMAGSALSRSEAYFVLTSDDLNEKLTPHGQVITFNAGRASRLASVDWYAKAVLPVNQGTLVVVIGMYGDVANISAGGTAQTEIVIDNESPRTRGPLRSASLIDDHIVVVGMDRQAYVRAPSGAWRRFDNGLPRSDDNRQGLEAVAGHTLNDLYSVGWQGEIWHYDGIRWNREDSPTHSLLTDVAVADDGLVYACGRRGLMVRGRAGQWEVLAPGTQDDLWSVAAFRGAIYASSMDGLYKLNKMGELDLLDVDIGPRPTYYKLFTSPDLLWSMGPKDVLAFDGTLWRQLD
jgi:hypothetical protein